MRSIKFISLHCTDTNNPAHDNIEVVRKWHTDKPPLGRGWTDIGYNFFIRSNGTIEVGRPIEEIPAAVEGHNSDMVAIAFHGKIKTDFNHFQMSSGAKLCHFLMECFDIKKENIRPHNFWNPHKECPVFDIKNLTCLIPDKITSFGDFES